jgi:putative membrane protein
MLMLAPGLRRLFVRITEAPTGRIAMKHATVAGLVVLAMTATPAFARSSTKRSASTKPITDQAFVISASNANMAEVELGTLAEAKTSNSEVRDFAKLMVADHQKALDDLKPVAKDQNITLPTRLDARDQALKDRLDKLSGHAFDRAYMNAMVRDHRSDVVEFRTEAEHAKIAEVKQYASHTLPTLEDHLKLAREIDHSVAAKSEQPGGKTS